MDYLQYLAEGEEPPPPPPRFKPCYKWITFNTAEKEFLLMGGIFVLNLVINGLPSIQKLHMTVIKVIGVVLNLVINGLPSIPKKEFVVTSM